MEAFRCNERNATKPTSGCGKCLCFVPPLNNFATPSILQATNPNFGFESQKVSEPFQIPEESQAAGKLNKVASVPGRKI